MNLLVKARRYPRWAALVLLAVAAAGHLVLGQMGGWALLLGARPAAIANGGGGGYGGSRREAMTVPPDQPDYRPVTLSLQLPPEFANEPALASRDTMFRKYGFNLRNSNELAIDRTLPDIRMDSCRARAYPADMPAVSVIVIYYNEVRGAWGEDRHLAFVAVSHGPCPPRRCRRCCATSCQS